MTNVGVDHLHWLKTCRLQVVASQQGEYYGILMMVWGALLILILNPRYRAAITKGKVTSKRYCSNFPPIMGRAYCHKWNQPEVLLDGKWLACE